MARPTHCYLVEIEGEIDMITLDATLAVRRLADHGEIVGGRSGAVTRLRSGKIVSLDGSVGTSNAIRLPLANRGH